MVNTSNTKGRRHKLLRVTVLRKLQHSAAGFSDGSRAKTSGKLFLPGNLARPHLFVRLSRGIKKEC